MIAPRTIINLVVFLALTFVLIGYGYFTLVQNPLNRPMTLYSYLDDTAGVRSGFTVALRGVPIGNVASLSLASVEGVNMVKVGLDIDPGIEVPSDTQVQVERANPLGEQQVDLIPQAGSNALPAKEGEFLAATSTPTPPDVGDVVNAADRIFAAVPTGSLGVVVHELAVALNGRAQDIRTLINASTQFSQEALAYQDQFKALLANAPPVLNTVAAVGSQLHDALDNTEVLADLLARRAPDIVNLEKTGTSFAELFDQVLDETAPNLACLTKDLGDVGENLSAEPNYSYLNGALLENTHFFGPIGAITPAGQAVSLGPGSVARDNQTWLRVRTLLPPQQPFAIAYSSPNRIPDTYPGAACLSVFGNGVPAGSQSNAALPLEGAKVIAPATPTVPVEHQTGPTPQGSGTGPGNIITTSPASKASQKHPETVLFIGAGVAGLGVVERREWRKLKRLLKTRRRRRRR